MVKWTACGESGIYSNEEGFRKGHRKAPDWERGVSYRQKIPVRFLSLSGEHVLGDLTISGAIQSGLSFGIKSMDDHWLRNLGFLDDMSRVQGNVGLLRAKGHVLTWPRSRYLHQKTIAALLPV
ncbi:omptin family outer membrane protease [Sinorhizobium medicae]|uniref:omptin family outer membrane protease n=1 Tax=Sinorhizobium medicae TaxID=110321 RepID=UPI001AAF488E|nr:omptin family outer membrane protease [Sinorhizobium medicae]MBO1965616.1 omptin family outer membrane protease [Sinorhizobium medicae]WQO54890.1 omptin family outer membrane protease [Sinorhizobium medicae]WQP41180.1 omptin family outer membrane protease [Sinorhizobium medicae]